MIWLLVIPALVVAYGIWTLAFATAYRARHQRREFDRDLDQACGYEAGDGTLAAELRALPAPGLDYISDRNVVLPRTPQPAGLSPFTPGPVVWTPPAYALKAASRALADREADMLAARRLDDAPVRVLPGCSKCGSFAHWTGDHDAASPKLLDSRPEPVTHPDPPEAEDSTFVRALLALPVDRVHEAFDGVRQ